MNFSKLLTVAVVLGALIAPVANSHGPPDYSDLFEQAKRSVVSVNSVTIYNNSENTFPFLFPELNGQDDYRRQAGIGSGVILTASGFIMTNAHVITNNDGTIVDNIEVVLFNKKKLVAKVIGTDEYSDIAILKVEADTPLPAAKIGDSDQVKVGNVVLAIGHPLGLNYTLTSGIISSLNRSLGGGGSERFVPFLQTDTAINPGNSGGPLLNTNGEVIGINSRIIGNSGAFIGYSLAIPINLAVDVQQKLQKNGSIQRGMLGVTFDPRGIDEDAAKVWGLDPNSNGVLINSVIEGSGAEAAGIKAGDVIISFNNKDIVESVDFPRFIADTEPGKTVPIMLIREGEKISVQATVGSITDGGKLASNEKGSILNTNPYGLIIEDLTSDQKHILNIEGGAILQGFESAKEGDNDIPQELFKLRKADIILGIIIEGKLNKVVGATELKRLLSNLTTDTIGFQIIRGSNSRPFFITVKLN